MITLLGLVFESTEWIYHKPRVDKSILRQKYSEGLIALGDIRGEVNDACRSMTNLQKINILEYIDIFGRENFFLEMTHHGFKNTDSNEENGNHCPTKLKKNGNQCPKIRIK